jgi:hypothetical protein
MNKGPINVIVSLLLILFIQSGCEQDEINQIDTPINYRILELAFINMDGEANEIHNYYYEHDKMVKEESTVKDHESERMFTYKGNDTIIETRGTWRKIHTINGNKLIRSVELQDLGYEVVKSEYKYDGDKLIEYEYLNNSVYGPHDKRVYVYNGDVLIEMQDFDLKINPDVPHRKTVALYEQDICTGYIGYKIHNDGSLDPRFKLMYVFRNDKIVKEQNFDMESGEWNLVDEILYTYDEKGNCIEQRWASSLDEFYRITWEIGECSTGYLLIAPEDQVFWNPFYH